MLSSAISSPPTSIFARNPTQVRAARSERIIVEPERSDEHFGAAHCVTAAPHFHPWPGLWVKWVEVEEEEGRRLDGEQLSWGGKIGHPWSCARRYCLTSLQLVVGGYYVPCKEKHFFVCTSLFIDICIHPPPRQRSG